MNHSSTKEPPIAHASDRWDAETRSLHHDYNGQPLLTLYIPEEATPYYRTFSNGNGKWTNAKH